MFCLGIALHFYPPTKRFGGYSNEPGVRPSVVCPSIRKHFPVRSITWIPFGIFWSCFTVIWNRSWRCVLYKNESPPFNTFWVISPLMLFYAYSWPLHNLNILWNIMMILHSYVEQVMTMCRVQEWQLSLSYFLSYFPLMVSDAIWCPLRNLKTLWNIIMILDIYVEQVMTMCRVQEWQLLLSYFLSYFPLMVSDPISCPLYNLKTVWNIMMILYSYEEQVMSICPIQEWQLLLSYFLSDFPLIISLLFYAYLCLLHNLHTLWNIMMILHSYVEQVMTMCRVQE